MMNRKTETLKLLARNLHPFPARMAPEIALASLRELPPRSTVLDPMIGSGTVIRTASQLGHNALGFDLDPLAVLMTKVATSRLDPHLIIDYGASVASLCKTLSTKRGTLPWIDSDTETDQFINFWFGPEQKKQLRRLALVLNFDFDKRVPDELNNALKLALSRLIITKHRGASLAWDVSHSRPHRVKVENDFDVLSEFVNSCVEIAKRLSDAAPCITPARIRLGDARELTSVQDGSVDLVVTSPPYLNAIDYMRGHKLALVWMGYSISNLRLIRSVSIGAEGRLKVDNPIADIARVTSAFGEIYALPNSLIRMIERYAVDLVAMSRTLKRVVRKGGEIHMVVGDSRLRGLEVSNSRGTIAAARVAGLKLISSTQREIPRNKRYLPTADLNQSPLSQRMLVEHVLSFSRA
jgi:hypothetical protein